MLKEVDINAIRDMYAGYKARVVAKETGIEVELPQGAALSPLLFMIIIESDVISEKIEKGTPSSMLFADDLASYVRS